MWVKVGSIQQFESDETLISDLQNGDKEINSKQYNTKVMITSEELKSLRGNLLFVISLIEHDKTFVHQLNWKPV